MSEQISIMVSFDTSFSDIQILKNELLKFITDKDNSRDFQPDLNVDVLGTTDMTKLELQVEIRHKSNWANESVRAGRRSKFMCALVAALRTVPIYCPGGGGEVLGTAGNPNFSVAISDLIAKENIKAAADKKEGKRLVPTQPVSSSPVEARAEIHAQEARAEADLNARNPAVDLARDEAWTSSRDDASTLGRSSIDNQDLEEMRGLLRRESTKGKRKAGMEARLAQPGIPTILEPSYPPSIGQVSPYAEPSTAYEQYPAYSQPQHSAGMYNAGAAAAVNTQKPVPVPPPIPDDEEDRHFGNTRPYSGV